MIKFKEYINEAFSAIKTDYGANPEADDKKLQGNTSFFIYDYQKYAVAVDKGENNSSGEVAFYTVDDDGKGFTMNRSKAGNPLAVLGRVFYVASEVAKKQNIETLVFSGNDSGLQRMYAKMVKNKSFLSAAKLMGFEDISLSHGEFILSKRKRVK